MKVTKTPKCFVGGAFIRSESGRVVAIHDRSGAFFANIPLCSKKDLRNAVEAAAKGGAAWSKRSPYNRAQILYRLAEMLESRSAEMTEALTRTDAKSAAREVRATIDRIVHFAGWADKYEQVLGTVNPVASSHLNFTITEPVGIIGIIAPEKNPLLALVTLTLHAITAGNSVVALAPSTHAYPAILLGEMLATSDLPAGVVNLLTGDTAELGPTFATHEQIRAIAAAVDPSTAKTLEQGAAASVKRVRITAPDTNWFDTTFDSAWQLRDFTEAKTVWHPIGA
jgi:acyl-CoA reductase-like NAD-dependent aldehyde dehydrogenase